MTVMPKWLDQPPEFSALAKALGTKKANVEAGIKWLRDNPLDRFDEHSTPEVLTGLVSKSKRHFQQHWLDPTNGWWPGTDVAGKLQAGLIAALEMALDRGPEAAHIEVLWVCAAPPGSPAIFEVGHSYCAASNQVTIIITSTFPPDTYEPVQLQQVWVIEKHNGAYESVQVGTP